MTTTEDTMTRNEQAYATDEDYRRGWGHGISERVPPMTRKMARRIVASASDPDRYSDADRNYWRGVLDAIKS